MLKYLRTHNIFISIAFTIGYNFKVKCKTQSTICVDCTIPKLLTMNWNWGGNCWCIICAFNAAIQCNTLKLECQMAATRHRQLINTMVLLFDMHCIQVSHYGATVKLLSLGNVLPTWWSNLVKMWISDWVTWVRMPILIWNGFHMNFTFTSQCHQRPPLQPLSTTCMCLGPVTLRDESLVSCWADLSSLWQILQYNIPLFSEQRMFTVAGGVMVDSHKWYWPVYGGRVWAYLQSHKNTWMHLAVNQHT